MSITSPTRYHEDYTVGQRFAHRRGHTVCTADNQGLSLLTMNTAQTHFNSDSLTSYMDGAFPAPLLNACVALALAVGLTSEEMSENSLGDLGYLEFRMPAPVFTGDTLYAASEVVAVDEPSPRAGAGVLTYRIVATKPGGTTVVTVTRRVLIKRRSHWGAADAALSRSTAEPAVAHLRAWSEEGTAS
ncbi:MaoC family dehydratase [Amycolatopsis sp. GM8]|uniref:MaoC family dehydratase n=1 Tax=Amycolatopsis sp. GM8 TaxID=2896530 RepID=UPI001F33C8F1|nr:MaoC family dehydratase [Amycolatopsis sp. GM8]